MKKLNYLTILWLFALMACAPDKNTKNTQQQTEYIINPPDFEELERQKTERAQGNSSNKAKKPSLSKEDSIKAYIKELTHHFHLQEKQMKALEYIYAKYDKKETQAKTQNDIAKLKKLSSEKEKSIEVVLGEHFYARKAKFDKKYNEKNKPKSNPRSSLPLSVNSRRYLSMVTGALKLDYEQMLGLKEIIRQYDDSTKLAKPEEIEAFTKKRDLDAKQLLGDTLFLKKQAFDKTYQSKK